jgi:hypothetical protein
VSDDYYINEPIVTMLNAVPALASRVEELERLLAEACGLVTAAIDTGHGGYTRDEMEAADKIDARRFAICASLAADGKGE